MSSDGCSRKYWFCWWNVKCLASKLTQNHEIRETRIYCLKLKKKLIHRFLVLRFMRRITILNASRVHTAPAWPRRTIGSLVFNITIISNRCTSIGNEYQLHCHSSSLNILERLVTSSANSHKNAIQEIDQNTKTIWVTSSTGS